MTPRSPWSTDELARLDDNGSRLERVLQRLGPDHWDRPVGDGWTVKQMLAHLAFWEETTLPVIETMLRGGPELPADRWYGGDTLRLGPDDPWPDADTHNAREASWADGQTAAGVLDRWRQARHRLKQLVATVTEPEALGGVGDHLTQAREHTEHHTEQLEAMA